MDDLATDCGAVFEATVFLRYFNELDGTASPREAYRYRDVDS
jgi:hypothetical protein